MVKKTLRIRITVYIEYRRMTDGQTNGQTNGRTDGRTDGQTSCHGIVRAMRTRHAVKTHGHGPDFSLLFKLHEIWSVDSANDAEKS